MAAQPQFRVGEGSEGAHWYRPGPPVDCAYEILGANGKYRPTTLRDARLHGLVPSVSTISRLEASPGLEKWKVRQGIMSALTHPRAASVTDADELVSMIEKDSQEQAKAAAARGTEIHAAIEGFFGTFIIESTYVAHIEAVLDELNRLTGVSPVTVNWRTETAACHPFGYGGRIDLHSTELEWVVDLKTKDFGPTDEVKAWPNQCRELAAYRAMVCPTARAANVFISRTHPGLVRVVEHNTSDLERGWKEFVLLLSFYQVRNNLPIATGVM